MPVSETLAFSKTTSREEKEVLLQRIFRKQLESITPLPAAAAPQLHALHVAGDCTTASRSNFNMQFHCAHHFVQNRSSIVVTKIVLKSMRFAATTINLTALIIS